MRGRWEYSRRVVRESFSGLWLWRLRLRRNSSGSLVSHTRARRPGPTRWLLFQLPHHHLLLLNLYFPLLISLTHFFKSLHLLSHFHLLFNIYKRVYFNLTKWVISTRPSPQFFTITFSIGHLSIYSLLVQSLMYELGLISSVWLF